MCIGGCTLEGAHHNVHRKRCTQGMQHRGGASGPGGATEGTHWRVQSMGALPGGEAAPTHTIACWHAGMLRRCMCMHPLIVCETHTASSTCQHHISKADEQGTLKTNLLLIIHNITQAIKTPTHDHLTLTHITQAANTPTHNQQTWRCHNLTKNPAVHGLTCSHVASS